MNIRSSRAALLVIVTSLLTSLVQAASPPGTTILPPIDLSPGDDVPSPAFFALNRSTHKLYVTGNPSFGLKVIDTTTNKITGGFTFGSYPGARPLLGLAMAVDESPGPDGNKVYVVGKPSNSYVLRIIDGVTDKELTGRGTDIVLPMEQLPFESSFQIVVNPTNHKVYISNYEGKVVVVDGVNRKVLTTLNPDAGYFLALDPVANKVFVLGANGGAIIDSATDTVSAPPKPLLFIPQAAVFNQADQRIYVAGYRRGPVDSKGIFVLDGSTGRLARSRIYPQIDRYLASIAIVPKENKIYAGTNYNIFSFDETDLSLQAKFSHPGPELAYDPASSGVLFAAESVYEATENAVHLVNRTNGKLTRRTTAYLPEKIAVNRSTNRIYVLDSLARNFVVMNGVDHSVIARVTLPPAQLEAHRDIAISERLNRIYVTRLAPGDQPQFRRVDVYNGATNQFRRSFRVKNSGVLAIDDTRRHIYFSGAHSTSAIASDAASFLDVYDEDTEAFITSIETKPHWLSGRRTLAVNSVTGLIYMSTSKDGVSVFDGNSLTLVKDPVDTLSTLPSFIRIIQTQTRSMLWVQTA